MHPGKPYTPHQTVSEELRRQDDRNRWLTCQLDPRSLRQSIHITIYLARSR